MTRYILPLSSRGLPKLTPFIHSVSLWGETDAIPPLVSTPYIHLDNSCRF